MHPRRVHATGGGGVYLPGLPSSRAARGPAAPTGWSSAGCRRPSCSSRGCRPRSGRNSTAGGRDDARRGRGCVRGACLFCIFGTRGGRAGSVCAGGGRRRGQGGRHIHLHPGNRKSQAKGRKGPAGSGMPSSLNVLCGQQRARPRPRLPHPPHRPRVRRPRHLAPRPRLLAARKSLSTRPGQADPTH